MGRCFDCRQGIGGTLRIAVGTSGSALPPRLHLGPGGGGWGAGGGRGQSKRVCVCVWVGGYGFCLIRASHNAVLPCSPRATLNACGTTGFRRTGAQDLCRGGHGSPAVIRESEHGACGNGNGNEASWRSIPGSTSYAGASTHVSVAPLRSAARTRGCRGGHGEQ